MPGDTEQSATANLSPLFSLSKITNQKAGTMAPENEETQEPLADSPTQVDAPVAPADPPDGHEVVQDQTVTETHVEERPASDDEDTVDDENEDGDSEE